jgi:hypothetical protein
MNHDADNNVPLFDDAASEREWRAQEHAMRRERLQLDPAGDDPRGLRYRLLARALRQPVPQSLPPDFAARMAAQVAAGSVRRHASTATSGFEFRLLLALAITFAVAAATVVALYGSQWLPAITAMLPAPDPSALRWLLAFASCIGVSWLLARWPRDGHGPARG